MNLPIEIIRPGLRRGSMPERSSDDLDTGWSPTRAWFDSKLSARSFQEFGDFASIREAIHQHHSSLDVATSAVIGSWRDELPTSYCSSGVETSQIVRTLAVLERLTQDTLDIKLHDEQLFAIWCLLHGKLVEMSTGEGKTVTAGLAAGVLASMGMPVHVITVNEYLVERDAALLHPLHHAMGLATGCVLERHSEHERRSGYSREITYVANKQVVFDYLRDQQALGSVRYPVSEHLPQLLAEPIVEPVMRGLCCAIIDEVDSVLIDDARTPCVLAASIERGSAEVTEAASALGAARTLELDHDFKLIEDSTRVRLTEEGHRSLLALGQKLGGLWRVERYREERVCQALTAIHHLRADHHYLVRDNKVLLIDDATGRVMPDRRLQHGLHRMLELKERVQLTSENATVAAISVQEFFLRYHTVIGMSGTLTDVRRELRQVYGLDTITVPPHLPRAHTTLPTRMLPTIERQLEQLVILARRRQRRGQPLLIGTRSVAFSQKVSDALANAAIDHDTLSARQDSEEARVIAHAGEPGAVTVATNMAGRGTDIPLRNGARARGGLLVVNLELNESQRIDRQLFGRAARQGDPGSSLYLLSLEDSLLRNKLPATLLWLIAMNLDSKGNPLRAGLLDPMLQFVQACVERRERHLRLRLHRSRAELKRHLAVGGRSV